VMLASRRFFLSRAKMLGFLDELEAADSTARSLYIPSELSYLEVEGSLKEVLETPDIAANMTEIAVSSATGAVIFWGPSRKCLISPPFPITEKYFAQGYAVEPLRALLVLCSGMISVLLSFWFVWGHTLLDSVEVKASSPVR